MLNNNQDSIVKLKRKLKELTCKKMPGTVTGKIAKINQVTWKQWKVPKKQQWRLQKLGISKSLARLTSYRGARYQRVVTKTYVVRAIS